MAPGIPTEDHLAAGWTTLLEEVRDSAEGTVPDLPLGLFALLRAAGMRLTHSEADVLSGHATQFLYHRDQPECVELAFVPPVDTLFRALDIAWKEVTPSGTVAAYAVLREWLAAGRLAVLRLREPVLAYRYTVLGPEHVLKAVRLSEPWRELSISLPECDAHYWRYPLDEGNVLVTVESAPAIIPGLDDLVRVAARRAIRQWSERELAGCAAGLRAYEVLVDDLRDPQVDFASPERRSWTGEALWKQWTARVNAVHFFERVAPRFGGRERSALARAAFCYSQCVESWNGFARHLGPTLPFPGSRLSALVSDELVARWCDMQQRVSGSRWIEKAAEWEGKAVSELMAVLK